MIELEDDRIVLSAVDARCLLEVTENEAEIAPLEWSGAPREDRFGLYAP